jgi:hypothetical protein
MRSVFAEAEQGLRRTAGFPRKIALAHPLRRRWVGAKNDECFRAMQTTNQYEATN